jgi:hypothetical protein
MRTPRISLPRPLAAKMTLIRARVPATIAAGASGGVVHEAAVAGMQRPALVRRWRKARRNPIRTHSRMTMTVTVTTTRREAIDRVGGRAINALVGRVAVGAALPSKGTPQQTMR